MFLVKAAYLVLFVQYLDLVQVSFVPIEDLDKLL